MIEALSTILIAAGTSGVTGFVTWIFSRRKYNEEVDGSKIENLQNSLDFYIKLSDDTNNRLAEILERNQNLDNQVIELKKENSELKTLVKQQSEHITTLTTQVKKLSACVDKLSASKTKK